MRSFFSPPRPWPGAVLFRTRVTLVCSEKEVKNYACIAQRGIYAQHAPHPMSVGTFSCTRTKLGHQPPPSYFLPPLQRVVASRVVTSPVMDGATQEAASRAIGDTLALVGVPAPTTLDGMRAASPDEMKNFFLATGMEDQKATDVAKAFRMN